MDGITADVVFLFHIASYANSPGEIPSGSVTEYRTDTNLYSQEFLDRFRAFEIAFVSWLDLSRRSLMAVNQENWP